MKKLFILMVLIFVSGKISSQTERYIYQTEVNPDTINLVNMKVENTFLDIKNNQSLFISESKLLQDSLTTALKQQGITEIKKSRKDKAEFPKLPNGKSLQPTFFEYFIIKNRDDRTVNFVDNIGTKQIYYQEDRKMDWDILQQFSDYNGYKVQKATMTFGGRAWTAWFAPEIKISDGPYKFLGLPGLILKLEDDKGDYRFSFTKKKTLANAFSEMIKPDARKSTRINLQGDKASVRMEMVKNKDTEIDFNTLNPAGRGMNQRSGVMNDGFGGQTGGGMNGGMGSSQGLDIGNHSPNVPLGSSMSPGNTNPIELSNR